MSTAILLSGGIDSIALAYWTRPEFAFTIDYGQVCFGGEARAARSVCKRLGLRHEMLRADCADLGSGDLGGREALAIAPAREWWPFRNQLIITIAAMAGVALGVDLLLAGSVRSDAIHADGTADFFSAINRLTAMQEGGVRVEAPAIQMTSGELVHRSGVTPTLLGWAHSCHTAEYACGECRGCWKRETIFAELGLVW